MDIKIEEVDSEDPDEMEMEPLDIIDEEAEFNLDIPMQPSVEEDMPGEMLFSLSRKSKPPQKVTSLQTRTSFSLMRLENSLVRRQQMQKQANSFAPEDRLLLSPGNSRSHSFAEGDSD